MNLRPKLLNNTPIIEEVIIVIFFMYFAYLCTVFHNREIIMHDYAYSFDSLWYFHHRITEGAIAQWNPYALLGKIAVQWNHVPVSAFTPFLIFSGVTLETFHIIHIIGTFLAFSVIYIIGRMLGYDKTYSLIPLAILAGTFGFKYYASFSYMTTLLIFYPIAISFFILVLARNKDRTFFEWSIFTIILSVSLMGLRFEHIIYLVGFILLIIFILSFHQQDPRKGLCFFLIGVSSIVAALFTNLWHISNRILSLVLQP